MQEVEVVKEEEHSNGWSFQLLVEDAVAKPPSKHTLRLSWADYNLWSGDGADPPHAVAEAVVRFLLSRITAADLPASIDAGSARRRYPEADREIPGLIGPG